MSDFDDKLDELETEVYRLTLRAHSWQMLFWVTLGFAILGWLR